MTELHELLKKLTSKTHWVELDDQEEIEEALKEIDRRLKINERFKIAFPAVYESFREAELKGQ